MTLDFPRCRPLDLSVALMNNPHTDPPGLRPQIEYRDPKQRTPVETGPLADLVQDTPNVDEFVGMAGS